MINFSILKKRDAGAQQVENLILVQARPLGLCDESFHGHEPALDGASIASGPHAVLPTVGYVIP